MNSNTDLTALIVNIYFSIAFFFLLLPQIRSNNGTLSSILFHLKRSVSYLKNGFELNKNKEDFPLEAQVKNSLIPWDQRKRHVIILFIICFFVFKFSLSIYSVFGIHKTYTNNMYDLIDLIICVSSAVILTKIVWAVIRLDIAFLYFLIVYMGIGLLALFYEFTQDVELIYGAKGVSGIIYFAIFLYSFHLIDLNKKHQKNLRSKLEGMVSSNPDLLD